MINRRHVRQIVEGVFDSSVDKKHQADRIDFMEENVILPVKIFMIGLLCYFIYFSGAFKETPRPRDYSPPPAASLAESVGQSFGATGDVPVKTVKKIFWVYCVVNVVSAYFLLRMRRYPIVTIQWVVVVTNLADVMFLVAWTTLTGALKDSMYWIFLGLIVRNAVSVPVPVLQIGLNLILISAFTFAGIVDQTIVSLGLERLDSEEAPVEAFVVRVFLMLLLTACCYGIQVLFDKQRKADEDLEEFIARERQLQTAGRMAAEIAHRIKNPLAIINNAVYALDRSLKKGDDKARPERQIEIIREEIDRSDIIVTELMGYAQLAEGRIENIEPAEALDSAIDKVFPEGSDYEVSVERRYDTKVPNLKMQRVHLSEILVNLLHNARDVLRGKGQVTVTLSTVGEYTVRICIGDDGPGIPPELKERVFESYFSTRDRGSGLGLAIVKHNVELYGGTVKVESDLGQGATFVLTLPTRTLLPEEA